MWVLFATKAGGDLAAYFEPAKATMKPPYESCKIITIWKLDEGSQMLFL